MSLTEPYCDEVLRKLTAFKDSNGERYSLRSLGVFGPVVRGPS